MRIGLAGISTCGKTSVAEGLRQHFGGSIFSSDDYYIDGYKYKQINLLGRNVDDWEDPESLDWNAYEKNILLSKDQFIYVDCYVLYYDKKIVNVLDCVISIDYTPEDYEIALNRRVQRLYGYTPSDFNANPYASPAHQEAAYFEHIVYPFAMKYPEYYLSDDFGKDVLHLSAAAPLSENIERSKHFIEELMKRKHS